MPSRLRIFVNANAHSTYFYSRSQFFALCSRAITRWLKHHGLPLSLASQFMDKLAVEWKLHLDAIDLLPRFSFHAVQHLLHWLPKECVIHHGDHEQFRLTLFCPRLYFQGALNTWKDPELFEQLPISPQDAQLRIQHAFPTSLIRRYPWGFRKAAALPYIAVWLCLFKTEKRLAKRSDSDQLFSELSIHLVKGNGAKFRFHASRSLASTIRTTERSKNLEYYSFGIS